MKMAGGIGEALVCTAAGLCVAIPAYVFHRYFRGRVADLVVDMERQVFLLTDELTAMRRIVGASQMRVAPRRRARGELIQCASHPGAATTISRST